MKNLLSLFHLALPISIFLSVDLFAGFSIFESEHPFAASSDETVGDSGLFDVRHSINESGSENEVALLTEGEIALAARMETLKHAQKSIRIQALIFRGDESGQKIAEILKEKKAQGVDVKIIVDAASNMGLKTQLMYYGLKQAGIEIEGYEALYFQWLTEGSLFRPLIINKRYHDKMWIIDGETPSATAIIGGMNIANEYFRVGPVPKGMWRDQDAIVRGPTVLDIVKAFDRNFEYFKEIKSSLYVLNPDNPWKIWRKTFVSKVINWIFKKGLNTFWSKKAFRDTVDRISREADFSRVSFVPVTSRFIQNRPRFEETYIEQAYLQMINESKSEILIANAYFIPSEKLRVALKEATKRGVKVTIITNSLRTNDLPQLSFASRYYYRDLLEANLVPKTQKIGGQMHIYEWIGRALGEGTLHAKFAVFDRKAAIIGSHNLDPRSENDNSETVIAVESETLATELALHFENHDLPKSRKITWAEAVKFNKPAGILNKCQLLLARAFKPWL